MTKKRILFIHSIPGPYRTPLLEKLANDTEYDFHIQFMARSASNRVWKENKLNFRHKFLPAYTINIPQGDDIIPIWNNPTVVWEILRGRYDVVICSGWDSLTVFMARVACWLFQIPMIIWAGSTLYEKSWRRTVMHFPVRLLVTSCHALIAYGKASKEYLLSLGVTVDRIIISYNSVDIHMFKKMSTMSSAQKSKLKKRLGIHNRHLILFVGQLITRKGVLDLYQVVNQIRSRLDVGILWVGYGPLQTVIKNLGQQNGFDSQYFHTTHTAQETAQMYAIADLFVMPTHEDIYSNVVAEALASGLPVLTTQENGAGVDYIKPGKNGYIFKAGDVATLEKQILNILQNKSLREKLSRNTWDLVKKYNYDENVKQVKQAIRYVLKGHA